MTLCGGIKRVEGLETRSNDEGNGTHQESHSGPRAYCVSGL
jgi:hypothetical protein